ncbi:MAG TPA: glycosyltransferase family 39 protein [Polyangiaceae bacterium]|nr:glycosyltransferase family 39 protein [Polyangiaceae bacterium]
MRRASLKHGLLLAAVYALVRSRILFSSPVFGWRPADMAAIARNFARSGFHLLYPQVLWGGDGPGYVEMEFPITPFLTGLLLRAFHFGEWVNLVIPLACGFGIVWVTYRFGAYLFDEGVGLAAGVVAAIAPNLVMLTTAGLWADPPMVLFATLGLYLLLRWGDEDRPRDLWFAVTCLSLAILLKLTALYIGIPVLYVFVKKYGAAWWRSPTTWLAAVVILVPSALWYFHAYQLARVYHNSFGIFSSGYTKFGSRDLLTSGRFYSDIVRRVFQYHFTPLGSAAAACGFVAALRRRPRAILLVWLASVAVLTLVTAGGVLYGHFQYLLPLLPLGCIYAGVGFSWLRDRLARAIHAPSTRYALATACLLLFTANTAWATRRFELLDRGLTNAEWRKREVTGRLVNDLTRPDSLIIVVDTQNDDRTPETGMVPPDVFYFADRRGWYVSLAWLTDDEIERLRGRGASYVVVSGQSVPDFELRQRDLFGSLSRKYRTILQSDDGIVIDLSGQASQASLARTAPMRQQGATVVQ